MTQVSHDVLMLLRLPEEFTRRVLISVERRNDFLDTLTSSRLSSLSPADQISALKLLLKYSDLFLSEGISYHQLLLEFIEDDIPQSAAPMVECLLVKWQAHHAPFDSDGPIVKQLTSSYEAQSSLATLFSAQFANDMSTAVVHKRHKSAPFTFQDRTRARHIVQAAIDKLDRLVVKGSDALLCSALCKRCGRFVLPSRSAPTSIILSHSRKRKRTAHDEYLDISKSKSMPKVASLIDRSSDHQPSSLSSSQEKSPITDSYKEKRTDITKKESDVATSESVAKNDKKDFVCSNAFSLSLSVTFKDELLSNMNSSADSLSPNYSTDRENTKDIAHNLCKKLDYLFDFICFPLVKGKNCIIEQIGLNCDTISNSCFLYTFAVKALGIVDAQTISDDVFSDLVDVYISSEHQERLETGQFQDSEEFSSATVSAISTSILFFLTAVVHGRLQNSLATSAASRRLVKAIENCCKQWPTETVSLVLVPCLLPDPMFHFGASPAENNVSPHSLNNTGRSKKHMYELINRLIRQGILQTQSVNLLLELLFSLPTVVTNSDVLHVNKMKFISSFPRSAGAASATSKIGTTATEEDYWGWRGGSANMMGILLRLISAAVNALPLEACEKQIGCVLDLFVFSSDLKLLDQQREQTISKVIQMSVFQPPVPLTSSDCLKCFSTMLVPLLPKNVIHSKTLRLILLRLDEISASNNTVAQTPLTTNLLHAMVTANKNSGYNLLQDCLEEIKAILIRAPNSAVARNALAEVNKRLLMDKTI